MNIWRTCKRSFHCGFRRPSHQMGGHTKAAEPAAYAGPLFLSQHSTALLSSVLSMSSVQRRRIALSAGFQEFPLGLELPMKALPTHQICECATATCQADVMSGSTTSVFAERLLQSFVTSCMTSPWATRGARQKGPCPLRPATRPLGALQKLEQCPFSSATEWGSSWQRAFHGRG